MKIFARRLLAAIIWFSFSIGSLSWWRQIAVLSSEDYPIWWPSESAQFLPGSWLFFALVAAGLSILYILEIVDNKPAKLKHILIWVFVLGLGAILVYPLGSKDIFNYVSFARLHAFYGLNPYVATVSDVSNYFSDPFLKNMYHITCVSPYGSLWTWLSYGLYHIFAGFGLAPFVLSFKLLGLIIHLLITVIIYKLAESLAKGNGPRAAIIYGMNPLAIFELIANAHNDGPAILFLMLSLLAVSNKNFLSGLGALGAAVSFKFTAMLTVPFFIIRAARDRGPVFAGFGAVVVLITYVFFNTITDVNMFEVVQTSAGGFLNISFASLFYALFGDNLVLYARITGVIIFSLWYYFLLRRYTWDNRNTFNITIGLCFIAYFLFGAYMVHRWYYLWPLALTAVTPEHPWTKVIATQTIILFPCYTLALAFGEVNLNNSVTYTMSLLPALLILIKRYRQHFTG